MIKKIFTLKLILFNIIANSQTILTYVGASATVTVQPQTLVYNGGGLELAGTGLINNSGNIMIVKDAAFASKVAVGANSNFNLIYNGTNSYGQLYVKDIPQGDITGIVNKEYRSDYNNGITGRQQIGLPFFNYKIQDLVGVFPELNVTNLTNNSTGRFSLNSAFWWNHWKARFDQIAYGGSAYDAAGNPSSTFISPLTYYSLPRRNPNETYFWIPDTQKKIFKGIPASDVLTSNVQITLSGAYAGGFGINGNGSNIFGEKYYSYIHDPFLPKTPNWDANYGLNLYQLANPFLTNVDLRFIARDNEGTNASDGNFISNLAGVAYYTSSNVEWNITQGSTYPGTLVVLRTSDGYFQAGDTRSTMIKPLGAFMVKLNSNTSATLNLTKTRRFKDASRQNGVNYSVTAAKGASQENDGIAADKIVKQVAVVMYDTDGLEIDRTYYAVSPSAITGFSRQATLQAYTDERKIFTKEEKSEGGLDYNYNEKLYINEANEIAFKSKEIPLYIDYNEKPYTVKFEVYEKGDRVPDGLSNGNSFYFKNAQGQFVKIVDGESIAMSGSQNLGLYYEMPEGGTLGTDNTSLSQTIIAKKDAKWVVRFAKDWKNAKVEVYSAAGQLLSTKSQISTSANYVIPMDYQAKGIFLVRATSETGEVVIKKIVN